MQKIALSIFFSIAATTAFAQSVEEDRKTLSALNARFIKNSINNDTVAHNEIIDPDFLCITSAGEKMNRKTYMEEWAHGYDPEEYISFDYGEEEIRIFGTTALVISKTFYKKKAGGDKVISGSSIYTDTYIKKNGRWLCVQAQLTAVKNYKPKS
jgi:hypothetical protein